MSLRSEELKGAAPVGTSAGTTWLHRYAVLCACATFPLIFMGGLVTSTEAALAVPDWPTTYGQNMFTFPYSRMVGGIFYEHGHRLLGSLVGVLTIGLTVWLLAVERRRWLRFLGVAALGGVVGQGIMGGLRVTELAHLLAIPHACVAQAFFCLVASIALFTSRSWQQVSVSPNVRLARSIPNACLGLSIVIYLQLIAGAVQRHSESIMGTPLVIHVVGAVAVLVAGVLAIRCVLKIEDDVPQLTAPVMMIMLLLGVQLFLGFGSLVMRMLTVNDAQPTWPTITITTLHVAIGALLLLSSWILTLRAYQIAEPRAELQAVSTGPLGEVSA